MDESELSARARALANVLEPVVGQVYFAPECHEAYAGLGFSPSPAEAMGVALPDGPAYFTSRGSLMGQVPGEVVAAAFAVFNPAAVVPSVDYGWTVTDASTIGAARTDGAIAQLTRILGEKPDGVDRAGELLARAAEPLMPEGKPLFAGALSQPMPGSPLGDAWRIGDRLREFRGDSHTAAWCAGGFTAVEIGLLTELFWGMPMRSYIRTRAWSEEQLDAAEAALEGRGCVTDGAFTEAGRAARENVERATDAQMRPAVDALGDDIDELVAIMQPWGEAVKDAGGYLRGPSQLTGPDVKRTS
jgi:hypothetical protein